MFQKPSIKQPCPQNWGEMTVCGNGRFCGVCQKIVVDFTAMSDREVSTYLANRSDSVCGRFEASQLHNPFSPFVRRMLTGAAAVAALMLTLPALGQQKTVENSARIPYTIAPNPTRLEIHGVVLLNGGENAGKAIVINVYRNNKVTRIKTKKGGVFNLNISSNDPNEEIIFQINWVRTKGERTLLSAYEKIKVSDIDKSGYIKLQLYTIVYGGTVIFYDQW